MANMQVMSNTGKLLSNVATNSYVVTKPGSIIKLSIDKATIAGTRKIENDLIILENSGNKTVIKNFFTTSNQDVNKLVIEDGGELYVSSYDAPFAGLSFSHIDNMEMLYSGDAANSDAMPVWVLPLIALTAAGGAAIALNNSSDSGRFKSTPSTPENDSLKKELNGKTNEMNLTVSALQNAITDLNNALNELKDNPTQANIDKASAADSALRQLLSGPTKAAQSTASIDNAVAAFKALVAKAEAAGIDITIAKEILGKLIDTVATAVANIQNSENIIESAKTLLDTVNAANEAAQKVSELTTSATESAIAAKANPSDDNISQAQANLEALQTSVSVLQGVIDALTEAIASATKNGITLSDELQAALTNAQAQLQNTQNSINDTQITIDQAIENKALVEDANAKADAAQTSVNEAKIALDIAKTLLAAALAAEEEVLNNNKLTDVDAVNQLIKEANEAVKAAEAAKLSAEAALKATQDAIDLAITNGVDADYLNNANTILTDASKECGELEVPDTINKELAIEHGKTIWEAITDFVKGGVDYFKDLMANIKDTIPGKIVFGIIDAIGTVAGLVFDVLKAPLDAIGVVISKVISSGIDVAVFIKEVTVITVSAVADSIKAIADTIWDIVKAIPGFIADNVIGGILDPIGAIGKVFTAIVTSFGNVFKNVGDVIVAKAGEAFAKLGELGKSLLKDFTSAINSIVKIFYDAWIKNPIDKIIKPVLDTIKESIGDFLADPIKFIINIINDIGKGFEHTIKIIMDILKVPGDTIAAVGKLISDIINGLGGDKVIEKNIENDIVETTTGSMLDETASQALVDDSMMSKLIAISAKQMSSSTVNDSQEDITALKLVSENGKGDINLDAIAETVNDVVQTAVTESSDLNQQLTPVNIHINYEDDFSGSLISVAA